MLLASRGQHCALVALPRLVLVLAYVERAFLISLKSGLGAPERLWTSNKTRPRLAIRPDLKAASGDAAKKSTCTDHELMRL
ncbi:uncharacterized protein F5Z01DRAFT_648520 [Emericellopsis atlantica]|uniref:Uncharacterized protein n=1 Tax=Emericellopsis atlantica TaxID=2614577 RepID=A0A9P7ZRT0_9HYPO|nr:uncharacterized protein F5Z01DRAFT_648520 [Emericellopsis atlantica]KAG9256505.1 hypothetical protein F5Z01DRAFT_648520 [Emericellopsis atlantica]